jgi:hypothetical protein
MANTGNNQPGLAKFTKTIPHNNGYEGYTYITVLPYSGKVASYIEEIKQLTRTLDAACQDKDLLSIECETVTFQTYAEAKVAGSGAHFLGGENFVGYAAIQEATAESLQNAVKVLKNYINNLNSQIQDYGCLDEDDLVGVLNEVSFETGLWYV